MTEKKITHSDSGITDNLNMRYPEFAKRFKLACERAGLPKAQDDVGKILGVSGPMVWNYRNGEKMPSTDKCGQICKKLNVSLDWLINGSTTYSLDPVEKELVELYRKANDQAKDMIISVARAGVHGISAIGGSDADDVVMEKKDVG